MTTATHYTPEQAKDHYVAAMGEDLGRIFYALWQDVFWLHNEWDEYLQLFGTKPSRIKLMNDAAPSFFRMIQNELVQMIVLRIASLTDPPRSTGKSNLTIQQLPSRIKDQALFQEVSSLVQNAVAAAEPCRAQRHRRIAHNALDLSLGVPKDPLPDLTRVNIAAAISRLAQVLDAVSFHYITRGQNLHSPAIPVALSPSFGSSTMAFRKELKKWPLCAAARYGMTVPVGRIFDVDNPITRFVIEGGRREMLQSATSTS